MKIGIFSDTHDNLPRIDQAVAFFNARKVSFALHAGDFVAPFTISHIAKLACDWRGVFGNNDGERAGLAAASANRICAGPLRMELSGRRILMVHDPAALGSLSEQADLVICGHTHVPQVAAQKKSLLVNPGECSGWLSGNSTVAVVDLRDLSARIHTL